MSSTGVVQPLRNINRRRCCAALEQYTSPCRSSGVGASWSQRWANSRLPDTSVHCRTDTGRPGQRPWIGLNVARATSAVAAESAWCDHGAAHQLTGRAAAFWRDPAALQTRHRHTVVHCNSRAGWTLRRGLVSWQRHKDCATEQSVAPSSYHTCIVAVTCCTCVYVFSIWFKK